MGTYITGAVVLFIIALAARTVIKNRKEGKSCGGCCDGCKSCPPSVDGN